jgi:two-component system, NtrC family, sensor kinase
MWSSLRTRFHSTLRYKLLTLVLLPLSLAMAVTFGYTLYWFYASTQEGAHAAVRDNVLAARRALRQLQDDYQLELRQHAQSVSFRAQLQKGNPATIQPALQRLRDAKGFAFLHVTGVTGNWLFETAQDASKPSPLTDRAERGFAGAALEVFRADDLRRESPLLVVQARIAPRDGARIEERGLILRLLQPVLDENGRVSMMLDAGVLLNHNRFVLEAIHGHVFATTFPPNAEPIVALLLDDTRIAAGAANELIGERIVAPVKQRLVQHGDVWIGNDHILGERYIAAFSPLYDVNGQPIGLLQVGVREAAFMVGYYRTAALLLLLFLLATGIAAWIAVRGVRSVVQPIEAMAAVARAAAAGEDRRIGPVKTRDEIGELARQFDVMLDQLTAREREIQRSAAALEIKVDERTVELAQKNMQLQATIALLEKTREQLVLAEKLSALGQMAAGIAHEINNPAAVILGNLDVLTTELGAQAKPVSREIELIGQQVERIRHIVTSLLQFARARPEKGAVADVPVNQPVEDVLPLVGHVLKAKSIQLQCQLHATGSVAINVFDLEQVLINLIVNAANACREDGIIRVTTMDAEAGGAVISVHDNGRGIAPEHLQRVFDPFFTTDLQNGIGLGLSVSYGLVRRYGGRISVESALGEGTVFRVTLPRRAESAHAPQRPTTRNEEISYG